MSQTAHSVQQSGGTAGHTAVPSSFDVEQIRRDFPILGITPRGKRLVYLDNAATTQKPQAVIDRLVQYYATGNANIHRGVHYLSETATLDYEGARSVVRQFINAAEDREIVYVRGCTEAINLVANTWGRQNVKAGDEILITALEHHSNIVPWQMLCEATGARLRVAPVNDRGEVILEEFEALLNSRTRIVAVNHVSNVLGTINPVGRMIELAHGVGAVTVIDGAQAVPHVQVDVRALDADFYAFSAHKIYGPTGIGVLYGKAALLEAMPPWQGGGDMIGSVSFACSTYKESPHKFEAGTPHISGAIGMATAIDYVQQVGLDAIAAQEAHLLRYATEQVSELPGVRLIGTAADKSAVLSFVVEGVHPHDIGTFLDHDGVAIRTGHHCAEPLMERFEVPATARASFAMYNTPEEVDLFVQSLRKTIEIFR